MVRMTGIEATPRPQSKQSSKPLRRTKVKTGMLKVLVVFIRGFIRNRLIWQPENNKQKKILKYLFPLGSYRSISVMIRLVWTVVINTQVTGLIMIQNGQFNT